MAKIWSVIIELEIMLVFACKTVFVTVKQLRINDPLEKHLQKEKEDENEDNT